MSLLLLNVYSVDPHLSHGGLAPISRMPPQSSKSKPLTLLYVSAIIECLLHLHPSQSWWPGPYFEDASTILEEQASDAVVCVC